MEHERLVAETIAQGHAPPTIGRTAEYFQNLCRFIPRDSEQFCIVTLLRELIEMMGEDAKFLQDHDDFGRVRLAWSELKKCITKGEWHEVLTVLEDAPVAITEHAIGKQFKNLVTLCHEGVIIITNDARNVA